MADDRRSILGRWHVSVQMRTWDYAFSSDGTVRWRDLTDGRERVGQWSLSEATIDIAWANSETRDVWNRPVRPLGQTGTIVGHGADGDFTARKILGVVLPAGHESPDEIDPGATECTDGRPDPKSNSRYVDRLFTAVAYGVLPEGYYVYCQDMDLPILIPEGMVDFELGAAWSERSQIFETFEKAKSAARDNPGERRVAYFWGAGGTVVSPTIIGPATTPELYSTIIAVRGLRDQFVGVMQPCATLAIGMIEGPKSVMIRGNQGTGRVAAKRGGTVPPRKNPVPRPTIVAPKIKPVNGTVCVGGGFESRDASNLTSINLHSVGPTKSIPNHVPGGMEDMARIFEPGSVKTMTASRLRYGDVDWARATQAASKVMAIGGKVAMNVFCSGPEDHQALRAAFESAGFKNVRTDGENVTTTVFADF